MILRFGRELEDALEDGPCVATVAELRLQVAADTFVYPDVMVVCGGFAYAEGHRDMITNPVVVVEVLPESTERWDRGGKFAQYRRVASLREYVLVSQDAMRVEWFTREDGRWSYREAVGPEGVCRLERLGVGGFTGSWRALRCRRLTRDDGGAAGPGASSTNDVNSVCLASRNQFAMAAPAYIA